MCVVVVVFLQTPPPQISVPSEVPGKSPPKKKGAACVCRGETHRTPGPRLLETALPQKLLPVPYCTSFSSARVAPQSYQKHAVGPLTNFPPAVAATVSFLGALCRSYSFLSFLKRYFIFELLRLVVVFVVLARECV